MCLLLSMWPVVEQTDFKRSKNSVFFQRWRLTNMNGSRIFHLIKSCYWFIKWWHLSFSIICFTFGFHNVLGLLEMFGSHMSKTILCSFFLCVVSMFLPSLTAQQEFKSVTIFISYLALTIYKYLWDDTEIVGTIYCRWAIIMRRQLCTAWFYRSEYFLAYADWGFWVHNVLGWNPCKVL